MELSERACPAGTGSYIWRQGDTEQSVAARFGISIADLRTINEGTDGYTRAGANICVPAQSCPNGSLYVVHRGDTFTSIAAAYGISVSALSAANPFVDPDVIYVGQVICIPTSTQNCANGTTYIVRRGDTLTSIAAAYGTTVAALVSANGIANPNRIEIGQVLCIPGAPAVSCPSGVTYTVRRGDTLTSIAAAYGTTVAALVSANGIANPNRIEIGQVLCIPGTVSGGVTSCPAGYTSGTVLAGESYADLLIKNNVSYQVFQLANPSLSPGTLTVGQSYCVPPNTACTLCAAGESQYTIGQGETLSTVAQRLGVSEGALLRRNPSLAPCEFSAGQTICWA